MREQFNEKEWPMLMTSYKSNLMSSMSIGVDRLRQLHPHNPVSINRADAQQLKIGNGDPIRIITPGGEMTGVALVREGIMPGRSEERRVGKGCVSTWRSGWTPD